MAKQQTQNFTFTYSLSGKDINNKPITTNPTYTLTVKASTDAIALKKLKANHHKSVIVTVKSIQVSQ